MTRITLVIAALISCCPAFAGQLVIRDTIGPDSSATDGMPGGGAFRDGSVFDVPGIVFEVPVSGVLTEMSIVIFARESFVGIPVNDLSDILGMPMQFHLWTDGIDGGDDSIVNDPVGQRGAHFDASVNGVNGSVVTITPWGTTGPPLDPAMFTTFLVTADLSGFGIELEQDREYVVSIFQTVDNFVSDFPGFYRISGSTISNSLEDVLRSENSITTPGFVSSQLNSGFTNFAARLTLGHGDYNGDGLTDAADYSVWRDSLGQEVEKGTGADGNGNGVVDTDDYDLWRSTYGQVIDPPGASATVPEPDGIPMIAFGLLVSLAWMRERI